LWLTTTALDAGTVAVGGDDKVGVLVRVLVAVGRRVAVRVRVADARRVAVRVLVAEGRRVAVWVLVAVRVLVAVGEAPDVAVEVLVLVALDARVAVRVRVGVRVEVARAEVAVGLTAPVGLAAPVDVGADEEGGISADDGVVEGCPAPPSPGGIGTNRPGVEAGPPGEAGVPKTMPETRGSSVPVVRGDEKPSRSTAGAPIAAAQTVRTPRTTMTIPAASARNDPRLPFRIPTPPLYQ
jgi:hypothetical protein